MLRPFNVFVLVLLMNLQSVGQFYDI